jgi:hypothetical protein
LAAALGLRDGLDRFRKVLFPTDWNFSRRELEDLRGATLERLKYLEFFFELRSGTRAQCREHAQLKRQNETLERLLDCFDSLSGGNGTIGYLKNVESLASEMEAT